MGLNPVGASDFFLGFIRNCLSYFTTAKISFTSKLSINVTKTEYILVCSNYNSAQLTLHLNIKLGSDSIKRIEASKSFGVYGKYY